MLLHDVRATWSPSGELVDVVGRRNGDDAASVASALARRSRFGGAPDLGDQAAGAPAL